METILVLGIAALTSAGAYLYGRGVLSLSNRELRTAGRTMLECLGLGTVFLLVNVALEFSVILVSRAGTQSFVSLYVVNDVTWLVVSIIQGVMFRMWRPAIGDS